MLEWSQKLSEMVSLPSWYPKFSPDWGPCVFGLTKLPDVGAWPSRHNSHVNYSYPYVIDKEALKANALPKVKPQPRTLKPSALSLTVACL